MSVPNALRVRNAGIVYAQILLVVGLTLACALTGRPGYLSGDNVANLLEQASLVAILAVFMTVVLISGNFDLSVGSVAALSAAVSLGTIDQHGLWFAAALGLASGLAVGLVNGLIVQFFGINAFIVTLGTLTGVRGLVLILTDGRTITVGQQQSFDSLATIQGGYWNVALVAIAGLVALGVAAVLLARRRRLTRAVALWSIAGVALVALGLAGGLTFRYAKTVYYALVLMAAVWAVLRFTVVGRRLYAVGANAEAARLSGINVARYKVMPFVLSGLAAAVVGILYGAKLSAVNPTALQGSELEVLAAAILGGTSLFGGSGSVVKSVIGALFLFTIANGFNVLNLGANYQDLIEGVILIAAAATYTVASRRKDTPPSPPAPEAPAPIVPAATRPQEAVNG
jgi:ribose transport system permease protein